MISQQQITDIADAIAKQLADEGKVIAGGWMSYRMLMIPDAPDEEVAAHRVAFWTGAQHLFASLVSILSPGGAEPTAADYQKMDLIDRELRVFVREMQLRMVHTEGSA